MFKINIKKISRQDWFYIASFFAFAAILIVSRVLTGFSGLIWASDVSSLFGMFSIVASAKHHYSMHFLNFLSTLFLGLALLSQQVYFAGLLCFIFFAPLRIAGMINWRNNEKKANADNLNLKILQKNSLKYWIAALAIITPIIMWALWLVKSNLFYLDAIGTSLCVVGTILSITMYIDQFYFFLAANIINFAMYTIMTIQSFSNLSLMFTTALFFIINIAGFKNWQNLRKQIIKKQEEEQQKRIKDFKQEMQKYAKVLKDEKNL